MERFSIPQNMPNSFISIATKVTHKDDIDRAEFRLCEELSEEVKGLGHGSIESLGLKV